ncbi:Uncharacterised protein [Proteus mirabilis]|uniref:Uncharacterized protein n=1 Tax=Proteus mirabilis TaxID=584 RepID=A0A2X2BCJ7_PROMI|nr:Uncharacterised protein [Proteus mirabilis]
MQKQTFLLRNTQILKNLKAVLDNLPLNEEFPLEVKNLRIQPNTTAERYVPCAMW